MNYKTEEVWYQDTQNAELWLSESGLMVNSEALLEREAFFDVIRVPANAVQTEPAFTQGSSL